MTERSMLSQEEIDALLKATEGSPEQEDGRGPGEAAAESGAIPGPEADGRVLDLDQAEKDALGEIGNISMGSAATALSELLRQRVTITSPKVTTCWQEKLFAAFQVPYILIQVDFKTGLRGFNVLIIQAKDAAVIADLMMGGDGKNPPGQISEIELSAASEAMNQMIGTASTSLSTIFGRTISISPPQTTVLEVADGVKDYRLPTDDPIVVVSFRMKVGELVDTELMQIMSIHTAREEAGLLLAQVAGSAPASETGETTGAGEITAGHPGAPGEVPADGSAAEPVPDDRPEAFGEVPGKESGYAVREGARPVPEEAAALALEQEETPFAAPVSPVPAAPGLTEAEQRRLELLMDIPLKVSVILGRTRRPIKEVLSLTPGAIVELSSQVNEPVEILVNGTLIARGEVVAVNENFGVRITSIITPQERIQQLGGGR
ncbi:MAG: flagellar motor switch phosphatase FliY [Armatimonadetes bacterium]|nr:flagellar motor switch phosphatase FliY [Armatimonadota bacterium]